MGGQCKELVDDKPHGHYDVRVFVSTTQHECYKLNPLLTVTRSEIACVRVVGKCGVL